MNDKIINLLLHGTPAQRIYMCEKEPLYFAIYYFSEFFIYKTPAFHYDFYNDFKLFAEGKIESSAWIAFRESAKTSIAKILIVWLICYKKKQFINYDSYDKGNSEAALFDIAVWLQTNKKIIADFGQLYHKPKLKKTKEKESTIKRLSNFITAHGIKIEAYSTQESTRGRIFKSIRPDFYVLDDIENSKTIESYPITRKIISHIDEMKAGLGTQGGILYLGNYITEEGVVAHILNGMKNNPRAVARNIPVENNGVIAWPDKYVMTNMQAYEMNQRISDPKKFKISLEAKKKSLGSVVYETEMRNNPAARAGIVFDRDIIDSKIKDSKEPIREVAGLKLWSTFNPSHRYAIGADTAKGVGIDSNASCIIDFSTLPMRVIGTYKNNLMPPDIFAYELKRQGDMFGICLIAPELNNTGYATITQLKAIYSLSHIYIQNQDEKVKEKLHDEYGFDTNTATKTEIIYQLKSAVEDGLLDIYDKELLEELKYFDMKALTSFKLSPGMTRHFDLVMACAIAWAMRNFAKVSTAKRKAFKQSEYTPPTEYQG